MRFIGRGKTHPRSLALARSLEATARRPFSLIVPPPFRLRQGYGGHSRVPPPENPRRSLNTPSPRSLAGAGRRPSAAGAPATSGLSPRPPPSPRGPPRTGRGGSAPDLRRLIFAPPCGTELRVKRRAPISVRSLVLTRWGNRLVFGHRRGRGLDCLPRPEPARCRAYVIEAHA